VKIFIYKSLIVFFLILILFKLTVGSLVSSYEKKFNTVLSKENLKGIENKLRKEIQAGINKDRILSAEDAELLNKFFKKIQKEISDTRK
tara:strand:+ start:707 stop:973 length:267 start_codon:yes stop_codon:yes gene_type:complete